jgi:CRP-like cAMP-binding protein
VSGASQNLPSARSDTASHSKRKVNNFVLASLSRQSFGRLRPHLVAVELQRHRIIHEAGKPVGDVYFIEAGAISRLVSSKTEPPVETAMVGRFGFVGISVLLGTTVASQRAIVQIPGVALRISAHELRAAIIDAPEIKEQMLRYVDVLLEQQAQTVFCCAKHGLNQRLARWLLLAHDWVVGNPLSVTHDLLATVLGTWRPNVTEALIEFENDGILVRMRGAIRIVDRSALVSRACACHRVMNESVAQLATLKRFDHDVPVGSIHCGSSGLLQAPSKSDNVQATECSRWHGDLTKRD